MTFHYKCCTLFVLLFDISLQVLPSFGNWHLILCTNWRVALLQVLIRFFSESPLSQENVEWWTTKFRQYLTKNISDTRKEKRCGRRNSSVVLSAPSILWLRVPIPCTPSTTVFNLYYWNCNEKRNENKQKEAGFGHFKKEKRFFSTSSLNSSAKKLFSQLLLHYGIHFNNKLLVLN